MGARGRKGNAAMPSVRASLVEFFSIAKAVCPAMLGLGISQTALGASVYSGAAYAEHAFVPNLSTIAAAVPLFVFAVVVGLRRIALEPSTSKALAVAGAAMQVLASLAMAVAHACELDSFAASLAFAAFAVMGNVLVTVYWLSLFKGRHMSLTVVASFTAMALCEAALCILAFVPYRIVCIVVGCAAALQIPLMRLPCDRMDDVRPAERRAAAPEYLQVAERMADNAGFLISSLLAAVVISVAVSLLWGFPYGVPHMLGMGERVLGSACAVVVLLEVARRVASRPLSMNPVSTWFVMQILGVASLACYTLLPHMPAFGMAFLLALNDVSGAYIWCIVVAFMSSGRFDAHCYGVGGMLAFLVPGSFARAAALAISMGYPAFAGAHFPGDMLMAAVLGALIMLPGQLVLLSIAKVQRFEGARMGSVVAGLTRALGLGDGGSSPADLRRAFMDEAIGVMKKTFMLSDRETDVLSLYALGFTQDKIARDLHISTSTAHTHITHIYAKTDMHSRQEIIDYLDAYSRPKDARFP